MNQWLSGDLGRQFRRVRKIYGKLIPFWRLFCPPDSQPAGPVAHKQPAKYAYGQCERSAHEDSGSERPVRFTLESSRARALRAAPDLLGLLGQSRRPELAESGMTAFEMKTAESCCSLRIVPADLFRPFTFIEIRPEWCP